MTAKQAAELIGQAGTINQGGLQLQVEVQDVKSAYGSVRYQVSAGFNSIWVEADRFSALVGA